VAAHDTTITVLDALDGSIKDQIRVSPCQWSLSLADADNDGVLEMVCGSSCGEIGLVDNGVMVLDLMVGGTPFRSPVVADADGDGSQEIIFALEEGTIRIMNLDGSDQIPPVPLRGTCVVTPLCDNLDSDPSIEVVAGSIDSLLFVLDLASEGGAVEWPCAGGSAMRSGLYAQPVFGTFSDNLLLTGRLDVVGDIQIDPGAALTLERDADMRFVTDAVSPTGMTAGKCEILVLGSLVVRGSPANRVRLGPITYPSTKEWWQGIVVKPGATATFTMSELSGAVTAVDCQTSDVYISECTFKSSSVGVKVSGSSPQIDSNVFVSNSYGISGSGGSPVIVNNVITSSLYSGIILSSASSAVLEGNRESGTTQGNGLTLYSSSPAVKGGNRFENNSGCGIYLSSSSPRIDSCWVSFNGDCGIKAAYYANPIISKTSIVGNKYGLGSYINSNPILGDVGNALGCLNDIRQNTLYAVYNRTTNRVKAQNNWWGTGTPTATLFYGQTDYSSWLTEPPAGVEGGTVETSLVEALGPNPFTHSLRLTLAVAPEDLPLSVGIYDVRGRLVRTMVNSDLTGRVTLDWDGFDEFGNRAASGAYFISISSAATTQVRKVVLLH